MLLNPCFNRIENSYVTFIFSWLLMNSLFSLLEPFFSNDRGIAFYSSQCLRKGVSEPLHEDKCIDDFLRHLS